MSNEEVKKQTEESQSSKRVVAAREGRANERQKRNKKWE
jgi:hypothetical protein